jgi:hypothetical protein
MDRKTGGSVGGGGDRAAAALSFLPRSSLDLLERRTSHYQKRSVLASLVLGMLFPLANIITDLAAGRPPM